METQTLRVGIIGFGYWGPNHVRNFLSLRSRDVIVSGLADSSAERRLRAREMFPDVAVHANGDDLIEDPTVDAVVVATPPWTHYELTRRALEAGKHVLVEKPVTTNVPDALHLAEMADERDLRLMVGHTFEYAPAINYMRKLIEEGEIGEQG